MDNRTDIDLKKFKARLKKLRQRLVDLRELSAEARKPVELDQTTQGRLSRVDALQVQAMAIEVNRRRDLDIKRIDAALQRLKKNDYGYCLGCDEEINLKRLEFDPATPVCISCARE